MVDRRVAQPIARGSAASTGARRVSMADSAHPRRAGARLLRRRRGQAVDVRARLGDLGSSVAAAAARAVQHLGRRSPRPMGKLHLDAAMALPCDGPRHRCRRDLLSDCALQPQAARADGARRNGTRDRHPCADGADVRALPVHQPVLGALASRRGRGARPCAQAGGDVAAGRRKPMTAGGADVSVVVPTYNRGPQLRQLLQALLQQDAGGVRYEILVVDNASTDDTAAVVREVIAAVPGRDIRYLHEPRRGVSYARNMGITHASAPIIAFLDDDGIPGARWVRGIKQAFDEYPEADCIGGRLLPRWAAP